MVKTNRVGKIKYKSIRTVVFFFILLKTHCITKVLFIKASKLSIGITISFFRNMSPGKILNFWVVLQTVFDFCFLTESSKTADFFCFSHKLDFSERKYTFTDDSLVFTTTLIRSKE